MKSEIKLHPLKHKISPKRSLKSDGKNPTSFVKTLKTQYTTLASLWMPLIRLVRETNLWNAESEEKKIQLPFIHSTVKHKHKLF